MRARRREAALDVLILGPVPPPLGGVSVHVQRVVPLLEDAGFRVGVLNHFSSVEFPWVLGALKRNPWRYLWLPRRHRAKVVHYHHSRWSLLIAVALGKGRSKARYVLTLHADELRRQLDSRVLGLAPLTRWALGRFDAFTAVNERIAQLVRENVDGRPVEVVPAFLPSSELARLSPEVESFLAAGPTVVASAYKVQFLPDGQELYGLDTAVEAFRQVAPEREDLQLALFVAEKPAGHRAVAHWSKLERRLAEVGLLPRVKLFLGQPLVPAFEHDVVFVRPTRLEGDALSVREALHAGVPVLASDVADRPAGVVTFAANDVNALAEALRSSLCPRHESTSSQAPKPAETDFVAPLLVVYATPPTPRSGEG